MSLAIPAPPVSPIPAPPRGPAKTRLGKAKYSTSIKGKAPSDKLYRKLGVSPIKFSLSFCDADFLDTAYTSCRNSKKCVHCDYANPIMHKIFNHVLSHNIRFFCSCGFSAKSRDTLPRHTSKCNIAENTPEPNVFYVQRKHFTTFRHSLGLPEGLRFCENVTSGPVKQDAPVIEASASIAGPSGVKSRPRRVGNSRSVSSAGRAALRIKRKRASTNHVARVTLSSKAIPTRTITPASTSTGDDTPTVVLSYPSTSQSAPIPSLSTSLSTPLTGNLLSKLSALHSERQHVEAGNSELQVTISNNMKQLSNLQAQLSKISAQRAIILDILK